MMSAVPVRHALVAGLLLLSACGDRKQAEPVKQAQPAQNAAAPGNASDTTLLRRQAVQDAIHRALTTGQNQRWQDGGLSGYAVPSLTPLPNGCRTVRYTVDQRPDAPMMTINACDASH